MQYPVNWACQNCGKIHKTTYDVHPDDVCGDPDDCCMAGESMNMIPICAICGQKLIEDELIGEGGLCQHQGVPE